MTDTAQGIKRLASINIRVPRPKPGYEPGSGGTPKTVGIHGGGLSIDIAQDRCYADARKRWEAGLPEDIKETAIAAERATTHYYACIIMEGDPSDREGSLRRFAEYQQVLHKAGWETVEARIENNPMLTGPSVAMWCELRKAKTAKEILL